VTASGAVRAGNRVDALTIATEWRDFAHVRWRGIRKVDRTPVVIDGRAVLDAEAMRDVGSANLDVSSGVVRIKARV